MNRKVDIEDPGTLHFLTSGHEIDLIIKKFNISRAYAFRLMKKLKEKEILVEYKHERGFTEKDREFIIKNQRLSNVSLCNALNKSYNAIASYKSRLRKEGVIDKKGDIYAYYGD